MDWVIGVWLTVMSVVVVNLCAAGVIAILHGWRSKTRRGRRILTASAVAGLIPASTMLTIGLAEDGWPSLASEEALIVALAFAVILATAMLVAVPGALVVDRKLDGPGDAYRAFE